MELPKNITQIGESNPHCKIYVEDYAISYIKQLNRLSVEKSQAVALYGRKTEESGITYIFLYGACRLQFLQRESRHLSQAVMLEVEKQRKKHFMEHTFLAYCILQGEMVEGFYVCEQGTCRYVEGYAGFFEKNDSMLTFMLTDRQEEAQPEVVEQEKYEMVRKRQEERREASGRRGYEMAGKGIESEEKQGQQRAVSEESEVEIRQTSEARRSMSEESKKNEISAGNFGKMRWAVAVVFAVLCVVGLLDLGKGVGFSDIQVAAGKIVDALTEQKLPDQAQAVNASAQAGTIVAEEKLTEALKVENAVAEEQKTSPEVVEITPSPTVEPTAAPTPAPTPVPTEVPTPEPTAAPASYVVQEGDTLSAICWRVYGSDAMMGQVCELNGIDNPDRIKVGAKILLPQ